MFSFAALVLGSHQTISTKEKTKKTRHDLQKTSRKVVEQNWYYLLM